MKTLLSILTLLLIFVNQVAAQTNETVQAAPTIVKTIPDFGDCQADSSITQVIVEFDQDMSPGFSVVNCEHMPKITGKPQWISKKTLSIPVQLNSDQFYQLVFNTSRFTNFRNEAGIPLNPSLLLFKTREINSKEENINSQRVANKLAFEEFSKFFPAQYSYADLRNIDWTGKLSQHKSQLENSTSSMEFALNLYKLLSLSEDPHISIAVEGEKFTPYSRKGVTTNFNFDGLFKSLSNFSNTPKWTVVSGKYKNIAYINILSWGNDRKEEIGQAIEKLKEFKDEANLIIDVRGNSGGNDNFASEFASCFVQKSVPYEIVKHFNAETKKFDRTQIRKLNPHPQGLYFPGKVYVLIGNLIMSSNESFVLMMNEGAKATTVGMSTYGSSGNPLPLVLSNKVTVNIPSWRAYTLDEKLLEGKGIQPDVELITSKNDFVNTDAVLEKVIEMINEKSKL